MTDHTHTHDLAEDAHGHDHASHGSRDHAGHTHGPEGDPNTEYTWRIHHPFGESENGVAVEVAPKTGLLPRWRFVIPADFTGVVTWGSGPPDGGPVDPNVRNPAHGGPVQLVNGPEVIWFGGLNPLSSTSSAYLVFEGDPPHYVAFGQAEKTDGPPGAMEGISFGDHPEHPGEHAHF